MNPRNVIDAATAALEVLHLAEIAAHQEQSHGCRLIAWRNINRLACQLINLLSVIEGRDYLLPAMRAEAGVAREALREYARRSCSEIERKAVPA